MGEDLTGMLSFLVIGTILGLSAGIAPGPLLALVISETMIHGVKSGIKVSLAPILTDLPIIVFTLFILTGLSRFQHILGVISLLGACFIFYLGIGNIRIKSMKIQENQDKPQSLQKGILANALSPHPYLFWLSVGGPTTVKAININLLAAISFILSFYVLLVGSKIVLAILVGKSRAFLQGKKYIWVMRFLGILLIILAIMLFRDGMHMVGVF